MTEKFNDGQELQVKSKDRVKDFGEVFTNPREVKAMLDLVKDESYRVDSRFLEPACGNGNFLVAILERKLHTVIKEHNASQADFEKHIFIAVSSIYAIDIQADNCEESRERMYEVVEDVYKKAYPDSQDDKFLKAIKYVLELNVILGNGLSGFQVDKDNQEDLVGHPIVFAEFTFENKFIVRKDFEMNEMIAHNQREEANKKIQSVGLFSMLDEQKSEPEMLKPKKEYKYKHFKEVFKLE